MCWRPERRKKTVREEINTNKQQRRLPRVKNRNTNPISHQETQQRERSFQGGAGFWKNEPPTLHHARAAAGCAVGKARCLADLRSNGSHEDHRFMPFLAAARQRWPCWLVPLLALSVCSVGITKETASISIRIAIRAMSSCRIALLPSGLTGDHPLALARVSKVLLSRAALGRAGGCPEAPLSSWFFSVPSDPLFLLHPAAILVTTTTIAGGKAG